MTLPFLNIASFVLSFFGILGVTLFIFSAVEVAVTFFRRDYV